MEINETSSIEEVQHQLKINCSNSPGIDKFQAEIFCFGGGTN